MTMTTPRAEVYAAIDGERAYQDTKNPHTLSIGEEIALALKYSHNALNEWSNDFNPPEQEALAMLRKVAGICVRCLEHHGAPKR
jgi:hypothetical protein